MKEISPPAKDKRRILMRAVETSVNFPIMWIAWLSENQDELHLVN